jgi:aspartyl-tRNA(Asn)/glutamyl-tRNA(Gln) amidotransferase subunit B
VAAIREAMPELPDARRRRFIESYGLPAYDAGQLTLARAASDYFEATVQAGAAPKAASNWMMGELSRALKASGRAWTDSPLGPDRLAGLLTLIDRGTISGAMAKGVFEKMFASGRAADDIVRAEGLAQIDDEAQLRETIDQVLQANTDAIALYRAGKAATFGFLVGQVMKATSGKANPKRVNEMLKNALEPR